MKTKIFLIAIFLIVPFLSNKTKAQELFAKEILVKADNLMRGETNKGIMKMTIVRPKWTRTIQFKSWSKGSDYSLSLITAPAKEKGQTFLKRKNEIWSWNPQINRLIKLPPSMMSEGWMDSDYSNDDLLKESSIVVDYTHKKVGEEKVAGVDCYKLELTPKEDAAVVWGKVEKWISKEEFWQMKTLYYDEDGYLVKTEQASKVKNFGDRDLPSYIEIIPNDEEGNKTIVEFIEIEFNVKISNNIFSKQYMKRVKP